MEESFFEKSLRNFDKLTKKPETLLSTSEDVISNIKELMKENYDFTKTEETVASDALSKLVVDKFDLEQIWQQLELKNESILTNSLEIVSKLVAAKDRLWFLNINNITAEENEAEQSDEENQEESEEKVEDTNNEESINIESANPDESNNDDNLIELNSNKRINTKRNTKSSVVDDEFFKLNEMENFLRKEESNVNNDDSDDEESVDLFDANSFDENSEDKDEAEQNPRYDDFFTDDGLQDEERNSDEGSGDNSEDEANIETYKSSLELKQDRLKKRIEDFEQVAIEEKPWQLKGEITADKRPQNSLLEEVVEFDLTTRPAPVVTEETTYKLEDIIRQRIKDKVWDDVERKAKLVETPVEYKKKLLLDQEKSKQSLAQIYEDEYLKQKEALDPDATEKPEEEPKEHTEIKTLMKSLFSKLDALSNFHFTPKTIVPELRVVNNMPAINMEEVAPVAASDAALLAPEEIKHKPKGELIAKAERTTTDKKRERRQKKQKQKAHAQQKLKKEKMMTKTKVGLGNKYSKIKAAKLLDAVTKDKNVDKMDESMGSKSVKSSTAFFTQLQEEVKSHIKTKSKLHNKKRKQNIDAKKLKL